MSSGRSIAPRPAPQSEHPGTSTPAAGVDASQSTPSQSQPNAGASIRKKVTSACQGCQRRRVKCDGNQPCAQCVKTKTVCSYTREPDGRSIKRKYHEIQRDQELLHDLLNTIRHSDDENISQIISLVRSDAPMDDVKAVIEQQLKDIQLAGRERSAEFKQLQDGLDLIQGAESDRIAPTSRPAVLEIQRLADRPLYKVPASPWTKVTDDDELVSNLISVWLTWDKGWHDWIDEDLFIHDMQVGSLDAMFCSPFLVNCLLAWACPYSDYREARTSHGAASTLMLRFIAEAKTLLETETAVGLCLTTVQGLLFLHAALAISGLDRTAYRYILQAHGMTSDLMTSPLALRPHPDPETDRKLSGAIDRTCWGVYIVTSQTLTALLKPQTMRPPRRARPGHTGPALRLWRPYPYRDDPVPSYRDELFLFGCDLAIIEAELSQLLFDKGEPPARRALENKILDLHSQMERLVAELPQQLDPLVGSCPTLFANRARIHSTTIRMFLTLREAVEGSSPNVVQTAKVRCVDAAVEVAHVVSLFMESWTASMLGCIMSVPCLLSLLVLLEEMDTSHYSREITDLCIALRAMSRRFPICMGMLRMAQVEARTKGWKLPPQTDKVFEEFESSAWRARETKSYATLYPAVHANLTANLTGDEVDMGEFLESMERLELQDSETHADAT